MFQKKCEDIKKGGGGMKKERGGGYTFPHYDQAITVGKQT